MRVLVGYASAFGSTQGIAARIADRLRARALDVDLALLGTQTVAAYDAFVLGSAIHDQAWLAPALAFLARNAAVVAAHPVWLYSVGMPAALARPLRALAAAELDKVAATLPAEIRPRGHMLFSGAVAREQLPRFGRMVFRLFGGRYGDFRDWQAIDAWADEIALALARAPRV